MGGLGGRGLGPRAPGPARGPGGRWAAAGTPGACLIDMDKPGRHFFGRSPFPAAVDRFHDWIQTEHTVGVLVEAAAAAGLAAAVVAEVRRVRVAHST